MPETSPRPWSVVFPLGMYSVATLTFGKAAHLAFMEPLARFMLWVAVAAWVLVGAAFLARLAHHRREPASTATTNDMTTKNELPWRGGMHCACIPGRLSLWIRLWCRYVTSRSRSWPR